MSNNKQIVIKCDNLLGRLWHSLRPIKLNVDARVCADHIEYDVHSRRDLWSKWNGSWREQSSETVCWLSQFLFAHSSRLNGSGNYFYHAPSDLSSKKQTRHEMPTGESKFSPVICFWITSTSLLCVVGGSYRQPIGPVHQFVPAVRLLMCFQEKSFIRPETNVPTVYN
jgi:hypothetical protein